MRMPAIALTDTGNLFGALEFFRYAWRKGVKPILGCEFYLAANSRFEKNDDTYHLTVLARDETGYHNLMKLSSAGFLQGAGRAPCIDREILCRLNGGLLGLSSGPRGEVGDMLLKGNGVRARQAAERYLEIFGEENFFLEVMNHNLEQEKSLLEPMRQLAQETGIPCVATNHVFYLEREDAAAHDVLVAIRTGEELKREDDPASRGDQFYLKSEEEMAAAIGPHPEELALSLRIAERCNLEIGVEKRSYFPAFGLPSGERSSHDYLTKLCKQGLGKRGENGAAEQTRLGHELEVIAEVGYADYFLVVWDMVRFAREQGIGVGPGRGSAAGSLVAYVLGITQVNPLPYGLHFERFLNPERVSPPDIDLDFVDERRNELFDYLMKKYGRENVARIGTFNRLQARAALREVGRVTGTPSADIDEMLRQLPEGGEGLADALSQAPRFAAAAEKHPRVLKIARQLEGLLRNASVHAAGVVLSKEPLSEIVPLSKSSGPGETGVVVTQYTKDDIDSLGLVKIDILGLRNLTVIENCLRMIGKAAVELEIGPLPLDDKKTYELIASGETTGIFQLESSGMRDFARRLQPREFKDLVALLAIFRPGPLGKAEEYVKRRLGLAKPPKVHPAVESILKETHGVMIYQEQLMAIAVAVGGMSLGRADILRKAISSTSEKLMSSLKAEFITGAKEKGAGKKTAENIFAEMEEFARYGFNKSHSVAYALISYQTAYLKANYTAEFMSSLMSSVAGDVERIGESVSECRRMGVEVLPPSVNKSGVFFKIEQGAIRYGLAAVKNVGLAAAEALVAGRDEAGGGVETFYDLLVSTKMAGASERALASLIRVGACDEFGHTRRAMIDKLEAALKVAARDREDKERGQDNLFAGQNEGDRDAALLHIEDQGGTDYTRGEKLRGERDLTGAYFSGHPLQDYRQEMRYFARDKIGGIAEMSDGRKVSVAGYVLGVRSGHVRDTGDEYLRFRLEDDTGRIEAIAWPQVARRSGVHIQRDTAVYLMGNVDRRGQRLNLIAEDVGVLEDAWEGLTSSVHLKVKQLVPDEDFLSWLKEKVAQHRGDKPFYLHLMTKEEGEVVIDLGENLCVKPSRELVAALSELSDVEDLEFRKE